MNTWTRRQWLAGAAAAVASGAQQRPNILLIMTDQQWAGDIGASGNKYVQTPNLDRLARGGTRFENSWCTSPVCSPARSSLITGCLPHTTRVIYNGDHLNPSVPTLAEIFRGSGYDAVWVGKWHLPASSPGAHVPANAPMGPLSQRGFGFLTYPISEARLTAFGDYTDHPVADSAAAFIRRKHDRPFVLGVSFLNPHDICYWIVNKLPRGHPSAEPIDVPERDLPPLPVNFTISTQEPEFVSRCRRRSYYGEENTATVQWDELHWRRYLWAYYRMTERVDRCCGKVLDALREAGLEENTIVVFTADHGEGMAAHHWVVKLMLYQETLSVPLIFRYNDRVPAGRVDRKTLASGMDVLPTLCDLAGVQAPAGIHGHSLFSRDRARDRVFAQLAPDTKDASLQGRAVRNGRFKYISFSSGARPEMLFDLQNDPGEMRNLASDARFHGEVERQRALMERWIRQTGDTYKPAAAI